MTEKDSAIHEQSLMDRIGSLTREINNLRDAYIIANNRLNKLLSLAAKTSQQLSEEAGRVEDFALLAVEATKLTEQSALLTNNIGLIAAAKKSTFAATTVHSIAIELRTIKLVKLAINNLETEI